MNYGTGNNDSIRTGCKDKTASDPCGVKEVFDQIESKEGTVHAYLDLYKKEAYARAKGVEKGIAEAVLKGPLAAYPVIGVKAVLYDGSYHPVDSSEMAFKTATVQAFKKGFMEAGPVLLEPIASVKVTVPDDYTGDVMGDLNKRRGRVLGMNPDHNGNTIIAADVPLLEIYGYSTGGCSDDGIIWILYNASLHDRRKGNLFL